MQDLFGGWAWHPARPQHHRSLGVRAELDVALPRKGLLTAFASARQERFEPQNLLRPQSRLLASRRQEASVGAEVEIPLLEPRLKLNVGAQLEALHDRFFGQKTIGASALLPARDHIVLLASPRLGFNLALTSGWVLQGHRASAGPSFTNSSATAAVLNTDRNEQGKAGILAWSIAALRGRCSWRVAYRNTVANLIRFVRTPSACPSPTSAGLSFPVETARKRAADLVGAGR